MSKILVAALFGVCAVAFVAAPIAANFSSGKITVASAFAKHGADDVVPEPQRKDFVPSHCQAGLLLQCLQAIAGTKLLPDVFSSMTESASSSSRTFELSFPLNVVDGTLISTLGDALDLCAHLTENDRAKGHWRVAIKMVDMAVQEPSYLKAATLSLHTALLLDRRLSRTVPSSGKVY